MTVRLRHLYAMEESYRKATANLASLAQGGKAKKVRIRDDFLYRLEPAPGDASDRRLPGREHRPSASRIMNSRGAALRLMLIALFEAQMRVRPGGQPDNPRPLQGTGATIGWTDLLATDAKAAGAGRSRMSVAAKKGRHLFSAIENLAKEELVSLPHGADTRNKHRGFLLNWEGGRRPVGATPLYTVPKADEPYFTLPLTVFTHGWIYVLEDTELLFLLMLAYFDRSAPDGFRVDSDTRLLHIGMGRDAYESHTWFSRFSLASVIPAPGRHLNGTVDDFGKGGEAIPHMLRLLPGGLDADALGEVSKEVDRQLVRPTPSV